MTRPLTLHDIQPIAEAAWKRVADIDRLSDAMVEECAKNGIIAIAGKVYVDEHTGKPCLDGWVFDGVFDGARPRPWLARNRWGLLGVAFCLVFASVLWSIFREWIQPVSVFIGGAVGWSLAKWQIRRAARRSEEMAQQRRETTKDTTPPRVWN